VQPIVATDAGEHDVAQHPARLVELRVRHQARAGLAVAELAQADACVVGVRISPRATLNTVCAHTEGARLREPAAGAEVARARRAKDATTQGLRRAAKIVGADATAIRLTRIPDGTVAAVGWPIDHIGAVRVDAAQRRHRWVRYGRGLAKRHGEAATGHRHEHGPVGSGVGAADLARVAKVRVRV